jgi:hypothetical protein
MEGIWLGEVASEPLNPILIDVVPDSTLTLGWTAPLTDGCLTILSYTVSKDGVDHATDIDPSLTSYTDDITTDGSIGDLITYQIKALNHAGESIYSESLTIMVGLKPNQP